MIFFLTTRRNNLPCGQYLRAIWPSPEGASIRRVAYEDLAAFRPRPGLYVFSDVELLDEAQRSAALALHSLVNTRGAGWKSWNHPARSALRYEVLKKMETTGRNRFRAFRAREAPPADLHFPVFVRAEHEHSGNLTPLLRDRAELDEALRRLLSDARVAGTPLLVVEYLHYADAGGVFRKYSMFKMGDALIRKHLLFSEDWMLRQPNGGRFHDAEWIEEEKAFLAGGGDAHDAELRAIFEELAIDYGRIDYTIVDGSVQVFEVNSNPMLLKESQMLPGPRQGLHLDFQRQAAAAWTAANPEKQPAWFHRARWRVYKPKLRVGEQARAQCDGGVVL